MFRKGEITKMQQTVILFRNRRHKEGASKLFLIQEYVARPTLIFFALFGVVLLYLLARHQSIVLPGIIGALLVVVLGNYFGYASAKSSYMEIGFVDEYFFMKSAYDVAYDKNLKFYPRSYANPTREGSTIYVNYIDHVVRLKADEWENWNGLWQMFNEAYIPRNIS